MLLSSFAMIEGEDYETFKLEKKKKLFGYTSQKDYYIKMTFSKQYQY